MPSRNNIRLLRGVCAAFALAALSKYVAAATWFVSPCGNDAWAGVTSNCVGPLGAKRTIQAAINAASSGDQISVMPGAYVGTIDTDGKAIHILGVGGAAVTILNGNGAQHVVTINSLEGAGTIIEGLTITGGGGAIIALASPNFINCIFTGNHADDEGGAVWTSLASPTFTGCAFSNNDADLSGGALHAFNGGVSLIGCIFDENQSGDDGGAISFNGGTHDLEDCDLTQNYASQIGGALHANNANVSMASCSFIGNEGFSQGGAIGAGGASPRVIEMRDCVLQSNEAGTSGGAIRAMDAVSVSMLRCDILDNVAASAGGAVYCWGESLRMTNCRVIGNVAAQAAGVLVGDADGRLVNCVFSENAASNFGGAVLVGGSGDCEIVNCTITGNSSALNGSAIFSNGDATSVRNSIIWGNPGMQVGGLTPVDVRHSLMPRSMAGIGCISADPMFTDALARDFSLAAGSPAIDAGLNWHLPFDVSDADGDGDVAERIDVDLQGDARVADGSAGGCGPAAIVDMGAIEAPGAAGVVLDGDVNGDGVVNVSDLLAIISGWGNAFTCSHIDLNGDGTVNVTDLLIVISNWG